MRRASAPAKLNLALVVGPRRSDDRHEVATVLQRIDLVDRVSIATAATLEISGFPQDTIVRDGLTMLADAAGVEPAWAVRLDKKIPVAAGLGGGSSDAATALRLANKTLERPLAHAALLELAATLGSDVPFFLEHGPQLAEGNGTTLSPLELPQDFWVVLVLPSDCEKTSTRLVYEEFDLRGGAAGFEARRAAVLETITRIRRPRDLAALPANDLATSSVAADLVAMGAFRADVTGAGPAVYGLFQRRSAAEAARAAFRRVGETWLTVPAWYG